MRPIFCTCFFVFFVYAKVVFPSNDKVEENVLSQFPLKILLGQKKNFEVFSLGEKPQALPLINKNSEKINYGKQPSKKTFYDYESDEVKGHMHKKKDKHKSHDLLNASIAALSYLAFGGYLLCLIVASLREKTFYSSPFYTSSNGPQSINNNQFTQVLQQYVLKKPVRVKFPAVTLHQGKKRK